MAQSRLEKIGTIFSRVSNLIRTGAMNMNDRPLWYDVYRAFPPAVPPKFERPVADIKIKNILYNEDIIRAKCHKELGRRLPATNLKDTKYPTLTQRIIELSKQLQKEKDIDLEAAYKEAFSVIEAEGFLKKFQVAENGQFNLASTYKQALQNKSKSETSVRPNVNLKDIMKE